jgi:hypothetical protein
MGLRSAESILKLCFKSTFCYCPLWSRKVSIHRKLFGCGIVALYVLSTVAMSIAQTSTPSGNTDLPPTVRYGVKPDPPGTPYASDRTPRLANGYTIGELERGQAAGRLKVYPDGTVELLPPSPADIAAGAARNGPTSWRPPVVVRPNAAARPTPGAPDSRIQVHPINGNSN